MPPLFLCDNNIVNLISIPLIMFTLLTVTPHPEGQCEDLTGSIIRSAGLCMILETDETREVICLDDPVTLIGIRRIQDLATGDIIRVRSGNRVSSVVLADEIETFSEPFIDGKYTVNARSLHQMMHPTSDEPRALCLDCRSEENFLSSHIPGSRHWPVASEQLKTDLLPEDKAQPIICTGRGPRSFESHRCLRKLIDRGYSNVFILERGMRGWREGWDNLRRYTMITPEGLAAALVSDCPPYLLDVRDTRELSQGIIPGSITPGPGRLKLDDTPVRPWLDRIVIVGADSQDQRTHKAAEGILRWWSQDERANEHQIQVLEGGFGAWVDSGYPVSEDKPDFGFAQHGKQGVISLDEFNTLLNENNGEYLFLDVRNRSSSHRAGVYTIPLEQLYQRLQDLPRDREILLFCEKGNRAAIAHRILVMNGLISRYLDDFSPIP